MSDAPTTRITLLLRLRDRGDHAAWERFVDLYGPLVYQLARRHGVREADAADLMQDVLLAVSRGVERYDPGRGPFGKWLYVVAMNKVRNFQASRWQKSRLDGEAARDLLAQLPATADPDEEFDRDYRRRLFAAASAIVKDRVDPVHWRVFWMFAVDGQSGAAVAAACGVKVDQVYVIRQRVQKQVAEAVAEMEE